MAYLNKVDSCAATMRYYASAKGAAALAAYRQSTAGKATQRKANAARYAAFPERQAAASAVAYAVRAGHMTKWPICAIPECTVGPTVAHHASYAQDMQLLVTWLCPGHHRQLHKEHRNRL